MAGHGGVTGLVDSCIICGERAGGYGYPAGAVVGGWACSVAHAEMGFVSRQVPSGGVVNPAVVLLAAARLGAGVWSPPTGVGAQRWRALRGGRTPTRVAA